MSKIKTNEFIAGYIYKSIEHNFVKDVLAKTVPASIKNIPSGGYQNDFEFPLCWLTNSPNMYGSMKVAESMLPIQGTIKSVFESTFHHTEIHFSYERNRQYVRLSYRILPESVQKMTVAQIEEILGYRVEIVSE